MMMAKAQEVEAMKEWKTIERRVLEEDTQRITVEIPNAQDVMLVFYGRENNVEDNLPGSNGSDSTNINGTTVINCNVTYIRPLGGNFYTFIYAKVINGYLDGCVRPKGNTQQYNFSKTDANIDSIHSIGIVSNNYFKKDSWVEVYYR